MNLPCKIAVAAGIMALSACVAPVGPVEVTRFHVPELAAPGNVTIAVEPAQGNDGASIEFRTYAAAVQRELARIGYSELPFAAPGSRQVAAVSVERRSFQPARGRSPVSVGLGGGTGSFGSGVGLGIGFDLSGPPAEQVETRLAVTIRDRQSGRTLWEGRSAFAVKAGSPLAESHLGAAKMAEALFRDFPGNSGETILVK